MALLASTFLPAAKFIPPLAPLDAPTLKPVSGARLMSRQSAAVEWPDRHGANNDNRQFNANNTVAGVSSAEKAAEKQFLRRVPGNSLDSGDSWWIELPVSVTEILQIKLGVELEYPANGINAKALYDSIQRLFARDETVSTHADGDDRVWQTVRYAPTATFGERYDQVW